jgi:hypothetical protein
MTSVPPHIINFSNYPLKDIPQPHANDVLCGRGGGTNNHIGNSHWRMLVAANKQLYITLPKRQKMLLSRSIVNAVRSQNPPGRFLQKDNKSNLWFDVGDQRAQEKTSQALREGAPDIRKKVAGAKDGVQGEAEAGDDADNGENEDAAAPAAEGRRVVSTNSTVTVSDTSGAAPVTTQGDKVTSSNISSTIASNVAAAAAAATSSQPQTTFPSQIPVAAGFMSSTGSAGSIDGMPAMPQQYFPDTLGGSFSNPMQAQNIPMFAGNNNNNNFAMMQMMYQTMMMSDGMNASSNNMMTPQQQQQMMQMMMAFAANNGMHSHMSPQVSGAGSVATQNASNMGPQPQQQHQQQQQQNDHHEQNFHHQQHGDLEPLPLASHHGSYHNDNNNGNPGCAPVPTFDEYVQAPDSLEPGGLSYGSMSATESEIRRLQGVLDDMRSSNQGNATNTNSTNNNSNSNMNGQPGGHDIAPPPLDGFNGISIGDATMMSAGTSNMMKLEGHVPSFGTAMSFNTFRTDMVEGGLMENIGTSFGSLSLDPANREALFRTLEMAASGPEIPPMFHSEQKAKGNLLDCSDTESENSEDQQKLIAQKSQAWEKMKELTETKLKQQQSKGSGSVGSQDLMPPPAANRPQQLLQPAPADFSNTEVVIPTTALENNFSTLSAWSAADDFEVVGAGDDALPVPPQRLRKDEDW